MKARLLTAICVTAAIAVVEGQSEVPYPTGYRDWSHIKSMVIEEGHPPLRGLRRDSPHLRQ